MKDKYKHLLNFTANIISLAVEACMFGWVWYILYIPMLDKANAFFNRGNWAVIGMYILFVFFFTKIFGGYRIGYMRISDIILSQILLATAFKSVVTVWIRNLKLDRLRTF